MMSLDFLLGWSRRTGLIAFTLEMEGLPRLPWPGWRGSVPGLGGGRGSRDSMSREVRILLFGMIEATN